ncbi:hypothetical protein C8F01DRAFT_175498 [Mycena amicta]|nr:hypothetical protein C8F01DRAFT_175498 [Mycena amicta]
MLEDVHHIILRRILGVGPNSGLFQLYSELGIYPLRVRRAMLALRYLRYLIQLPPGNIARKALEAADRLRRKQKHDWLGDLASVLNSLPFPTERLPSLRNISVAWCDMAIERLKREAKLWIQREIDSRVSLHLLHGRLEPQEEGPARRLPVCRRHYLFRVTIPSHRHALTRLLCGSFYTPPTDGDDRRTEALPPVWKCRRDSGPRIHAMLSPGGVCGASRVASTALWRTYPPNNNYGLLSSLTKAPILDLQWSLCSPHIYTVAADHTLITTDVTTGKRVRKIRAHREIINSVDRTMAGGSGTELVANGADDGVVRVWDGGGNGGKEPIAEFEVGCPVTAVC